MLFDTHSNLMWYPDHLSDEFVEFAWEAKRAKMKLTEDVYFAGGESEQNNAFDSRPTACTKPFGKRPGGDETPPSSGSAAATSPTSRAAATAAASAGMSDGA